MERLWTNRNSLGDFVRNGLEMYQSSVSEAFIAVAFFTEDQVVKNLVANDCHVKIVVRLGFPTNPRALRALMSSSNVDVRYYTGNAFHPKLYIFGDQIALLGSANLTNAALQSNQEIVVSIDSEDQRFVELKSLFSEYWHESKVLTKESLDAYEVVFDKYGKARNNLSFADDEIEKEVGKVNFENIQTYDSKKSKEDLFLESYRKTYQETVSAFKKIKVIYESIGKRKNDFTSIPIRLEIDSFLSFARDEYAKNDTWSEQPIGWNDNSRSLLSSHIIEWLKADYYHYDSTICNENYPLITKVFGSKETIEKASYDEIISALVVLHSFHDRLRFYPGGLPTLIDSFRKKNDLERVRTSLGYLLYGEGETVKRMTDLIFDSTYKLNEFGQSNVQELVGWINQEDLPVINGRTTKMFRYYGFDVRQL